MASAIPRIAITTGEPAGIGPELILDLARQGWPAELVIFGDSRLLASRARALGRQIGIAEWAHQAPPAEARPGRLTVADLPLTAPVIPGRLDPRNGPWVLELLRRACMGCQQGYFDALVTAPVNKAAINDAGVPFTGHTEFLAELTGSPNPVMLLVAGTLRVALVTTHLPLKAVPAAITRQRVATTARILDDSLRRRFGLGTPRIVILGLNPHAGESGHLGTEERDEIVPAVESLQAAGLAVTGPLPADTAFIEANLAGVDAVLAMYHDQGLPVLKHRGFGHAVNVTLGLPIIRTSVDHGTALDLAGTGRADSGSLHAAVGLAISMAVETSLQRS
ncbi:MAG: 4-hydroxythreonine-4-phosphate dehydrogenase PdxA [Gammaproteobacteria bacterium]|nr:4-hydroxythreonine-4-phosphate dehydrogenase PdxA [Gammaproteobacteria bacterium]